MQKEEKTTLNPPAKNNKTPLIILIITVIILILSIISAYLIHNYYSNKQGGNGSAAVNETNTTQNLMPITNITNNQTPPTTKQTTNTTKTTTTTGGGGGGTDGESTTTCTPNCEGKECGSDGCSGSCGTCNTREICNEGICVIIIPECSTNTQITKNCLCQGIERTEGYCCSFGWQTTPCTIFEATYYVDNSVTDCDTYNVSTRTCGNGDKTVYDTVQEAAEVLTAGETVAVRQGTYRESVTPKNSGNKTHGYITYQSYPGEEAIIYGTMRLNSSWTKCDSTICKDFPLISNTYYTDIPTSIPLRGLYESAYITMDQIFEDNERLIYSHWPDQNNIHDTYTKSDGNRITEGINSHSFSDTINLIQPKNYWKDSVVKIIFGTGIGESHMYTIKNYSEGTITTNEQLRTTPRPEYDTYTIMNHPLGLDTAGEFMINYTSKRIYLIPKNLDDPNNHDYDISVSKNLFLLGSSEEPLKSYIIIDGFILKGSGSSGVSTSKWDEKLTENIIIKNCVIKENLGNGISFAGSINVSDIYIINNTISNNDNKGIYQSLDTRYGAGFCKNFDIINNTINGNNDDGMQLTGTHNWKLIGNVMYDHDSGKGHSDNIKQSAGKYGFINVIWKDNILYPGPINWAENNAIFKNYSIHNNIFYGVGNALYVEYNRRNNTLTDIDVFNNVYYECPSVCIGHDGYADYSTVNIKNNIFHRKYTNKPFVALGNSDHDYNLYLNGELPNNAGPNSLTSTITETFIDPNNSNWELLPESTAIDSGTYVGFPYKGSAPDIGAYEYQNPQTEENTYYVSATGSGSHDGSLGNEMNLSEAQTYANSHTDEEITFLLEGGEYGAFVENTERSEWVTWRGNKNVNFSYIKINSFEGYPEVKTAFEGLTVKGDVYSNIYTGKNCNICFRKVSYIRINNCIILKDSEYDSHHAGIAMINSNNIEIKNSVIRSKEEDFVVGERVNHSFYECISSRESDFLPQIDTYNVKIEDNEIFGCGFGITAWGENWSIKNNHIHDLFSDGIWVPGLANSQIINNKIHDVVRLHEAGTHDDGIQLGLGNSAGMFGSFNVLIKDNEIFDIGRQGIYINAAQTYPFKNITLINNFVHSTDFFEGGARPLVLESFDSNLINNTITDPTTSILENTTVKDITNNIFSFLTIRGTGGNGIYPGIIPENEDYNLINYYWGYGNYMNTTEFEEWRGENTIELREPLPHRTMYFIYANAPVFNGKVELSEMEINNVVLGEEDGLTTLTYGSLNFSDLRVLPGYDYYRISMNSSNKDFIWNNTPTNNLSEGNDLIVKKVEENKLTLSKNVTLNPGALVNLKFKYSPSTKSKLYLRDNEYFDVGDYVDYSFEEVPREVTSKGTDSHGEFIIISPELSERAFAPRILNNWKFNNNVTRDYHPLINSPACNGSINPVGVAVGALPCVCTQDSQCVEVYGVGSTCNLVTRKCEGRLGTQNVQESSFLSLIWNWVKGLLNI